MIDHIRLAISEREGREGAGASSTTVTEVNKVEEGACLAMARTRENFQLRSFYFFIHFGKYTIVSKCSKSVHQQSWCTAVVGPTAVRYICLDNRHGG
jgi:hypothetical protein